MAKKIIVPLIIVAVSIVGYLLLSGDRQPEAPAPTPQTVPEATPEAKAPTGRVVTISYQNSAFNPAEIRVKVGDTVRFVNNHTFAIRVSSNPHPIHTSHPALESGSVSPGASYDFVASEQATINYHNHFNPSVGGVIVVE